ncbi:hypothetical protein ACOSQ2_007242 [Xanthoceras sorbifolium]
MDVRQALKRCLQVDVEGSGSVTIMFFRYEWLPNFCTLCDHLRHLYHECSVSKPLDGGAIPAEYGPWLHASSPFAVMLTEIKGDTDERVAGAGKARSIGSIGRGGGEGSILDTYFRGFRGLNSEDVGRMGDG